MSINYRFFTFPHKRVAFLAAKVAGRIVLQRRVKHPKSPIFPDSDGTYYVNTLPEHTSSKEPRRSEPILEMRIKLHEFPFDLTRLEVPYEFCVQLPQPLNVLRKSLCVSVGHQASPL
jgi:hypothetical protein